MLTRIKQKSSFASNIYWRNYKVWWFVFAKVSFFVPVYDWQWKKGWVFKVLFSEGAADILLQLLLGQLKCEQIKRFHILSSSRMPQIKCNPSSIGQTSKMLQNQYFFVKVLFCTETSAKKSLLFIVFALISNFDDRNCMPFSEHRITPLAFASTSYGEECLLSSSFVCRHYSDHMFEEGAQVSSSKVSVTT